MKDFSSHTSFANFGDKVEILLIFSRGAKTRMKILGELHRRPLNCRQLAGNIGCNWSTAHKHMQHLTNAGLVRNTGFGHTSFYSITTKGQEAYESVLHKYQRTQAK